MRRITVALICGFLALPVIACSAPAQADSMRHQIVVIEPPAHFVKAASKLGYHIGVVFEFKELSVRAVKVLAPKGHSMDSAISELEKYFPNIVVDDSEV